MKNSISKLITKSVSLLCSIVLSSYGIFASQFFVAKENGKILCQEGDCDQRYSPCSTFKIALSLMGFDSGILKDECNPLWRFQGTVDPTNPWKQDQTPQSWMKISCVWYSQILTQELGMDKFKEYVKVVIMVSQMLGYRALLKYQA